VQLSIHGARGNEEKLRPLMPPAELYEGLPDLSYVRNVARMYERMARDIREGTRSAPSFRDAVALHEVIDRIQRSGGAMRT
jgi:predicted dehydrogenase